MKFCPECGMILDGKEKCTCGYNIITGEVDKNEYENFKNREKRLYEQSVDNMTMSMGMNFNNINMNQLIFNKDNDNLKSEELALLMETIHGNKKRKNKRQKNERLKNIGRTHIIFYDILLV